MSTTSANSSTENRALMLLGQGIEPVSVAAALGVNISRISQLMSDETFAEKVKELKFSHLSKHIEHDIKIDEVEGRLLKKLDDTLPFMQKPGEILQAFRVINQAKRRTTAAPVQELNKQSTVTLVLPPVIMQKFEVNINNQVVKVGEKSLVTIQSGTLLKQVVPEQEKEKVSNSHEQRRTIELPSPSSPTTIGIQQGASTEDARIAALVAEGYATT